MLRPSVSGYEHDSPACSPVHWPAKPGGGLDGHTAARVQLQRAFVHVQLDRAGRRDSPSPARRNFDWRFHARDWRCRSLGARGDEDQESGTHARAFSKAYTEPLNAILDS